MLKHTKLLGITLAGLMLFSMETQAATTPVQLLEEKVKNLKDPQQASQVQKAIGICYLQGLSDYGCKKNLKKAEQWLTKATKYGDAETKFYLSITYFSLKKNTDKAADLLIESCKSGYSDACDLIEEAKKNLN
ncbi:hypothetical protein [Lonepinella sp. BR2474]|uniref:hypothetical protein n=1 Tax=Lonepinella sp. BR2474 TaxID=3434548 RepID=UPI003F6DAF32